MTWANFTSNIRVSSLIVATFKKTLTNTFNLKISLIVMSMAILKKREAERVILYLTFLTLYHVSVFLQCLLHLMNHAAHFHVHWKQLHHIKMTEMDHKSSWRQASQAATHQSKISSVHPVDPFLKRKGFGRNHVYGILI